jgi:predicted  nucleic acid-binding Zn-ribbon protein
MKTIQSNENPIEIKASKKHNTSVYVALSLIILCLASIFAYYKFNSINTIDNQKLQIEKVTSQKSDLQTSFDASLVKIESMKTAATELGTQLNDKNAEIEKNKTEIRSILNKKHVTESELAKAKKMIAGLNNKIGDMEKTIAKLTEDNKVLGEQNMTLTTEKENLTKELGATVAVKQELEQKVDVASTLNASNISIVPLNIKKSGKEISTLSAKKVDKMLIKFDLSNRIITSGSTELYVLVIGPDGKPVSSGNNFSGVFKTREDGDKFFTAKFPVALETAKSKSVSFSFVPETESFVQGDYKIEIYQNGFLIGQGMSSLKKGGLFS